MAKKKFWQKEEGEAREIYTSNRQQIKHLGLLNPENTVLKRNLFWSLKYLLMLDLSDFRMPVNPPFFQWYLLADQKLPIMLLLHLSQPWIVSYRDDKSFVMADIPGIIEGAHVGKGLGQIPKTHQRNSMLLFMVPADSKNIREEYEILLNELKMYNPELLDKKRVLAISKSDMLDEELIKEIRNDLPDIPRVFISSFTGQGI